MDSKTTDRRVKRTRRLLQRALRELMAEKRYDRITVQDILDKADIGRTTFYDHYQDKEDLATSMLIELMEMLTQAVEETDLLEDQLFPTSFLFTHIEENLEYFKGMMQGRGMALFLEKGKKYWAERIEMRLRANFPGAETPAVPLALISDSAAGAFLLNLKWWLDNDLPFPAVKMAEFTDRLILPGVFEALGVERNKDSTANFDPD